MFGVLGIVIGSAFLFTWEMRQLKKEKNKKDVWVFSLLMIVATGLMIAEVLGVEIPNPHEGLAAIFEPFGRLLRFE